MRSGGARGAQTDGATPLPVVERRRGQPAGHTPDGHVEAEAMADDGLGAAWKLWRRRRYLVALLAFLGFFNVYALRVNLSVAIVSMTANRTDGPDEIEAEFAWGSELQGLLLSAFFWGYLVTQLPGGWLAGRLGGARVYGGGLLATALLTLITPPVTRAGGAPWLLALRVVEGLFEGVTYPCIHALWARWAPPQERARLATFAFSGSYVGTVVSLPVCGLLANTVGWPSIFYVFGALGVLWFVTWIWQVREGPELDSRISNGELEYIQRSLGDVSQNKDLVHPWGKFLTSLPVWAIVCAHFCENWGFYTLLTQLPKFMNSTLNFDLKKAGFLSAVPYLVMAIILQGAGQLSDWLVNRKLLTVTQVRKVFNCVSFGAQTIFMLLAAHLRTAAGVVSCLSLAVGIGAFAWSAFSVNHLDVAPQHASVLMGLSNTVATLPGIISPTLTGYIVQSNDDWSAIFYIASAIYLFGAIFYAVFASGERQSWAKAPPSSPPAPVNGAAAAAAASYANPALELETA